jgi:ketosteroid isomerase-like protein
MEARMGALAIDVPSAAVADVLKRYIEAVEEHDLVKYATLVAHDDDLAWYGSMPGQILGWSEVEQVMRSMFEAGSDIRITQTDLRIHVSPDRQLAWATCLWDWQEKTGEELAEVPVRCTWVLERRDADWVIVHWHKSVGVN